MLQETSLSFKHCLWNGTKRGIYILACKQKYVHWMKIQYLSWMLHNIYCVPDEKDFRKRTLLYCLFFWYVHVSYGEDDWKRTKFTSRFSLNLGSMHLYLVPSRGEKKTPGYIQVRIESNFFWINKRCREHIAHLISNSKQCNKQNYI